ncbi:hypothetical protein JCM1393_26910 [Clostridium carnis]
MERNLYKSLGIKNELLKLERQVEMSYKKEIRTLKLLGLSENMNILEVGSGPGFFTEKILDNFKNTKITCLDIDKEYIDIAKSRLKNKYNERITFIQSSINKTILPSNNYDFVIARLIYQHLKDPYSATKEIYRLLKPKGKIVIIDIDNGLWGITNPENKVIKIMNSSFESFQNSIGGNRNVGRSLLEYLKHSGFKNLDFDAVVSHSDVIGKNYFKNIINPNIVNSSYKMIYDSYNKFINSDSTAIILLLFLASGEK